MSKTGPPPTPLAERLRKRDEQEAERYSEFLVTVRHQIEVELQNMGVAVTQKLRQILADATTSSTEHAETLLRSLNAERERIEHSSRHEARLLRRRFLTRLLSYAAAAIGIYAAVIGLARWEANRIEDTRSALIRERDHLQDVVDNLRNETWGINLGVNQNGLHMIILPLGTELVDRTPQGHIRAIVPPTQTPNE